MFFFSRIKSSAGFPKNHDVTVVNKPFTTLQQQFPVPKFRPSIESQTNVVYKIPCTSCSWCYIGETGRAFNTRKKEHLRNTKTAAKGSRIANHAWSNNHAIDCENASVIDKGTFRTRKTLEAWHTTVTGAPNDQFVVKCIIIPQLMKINVIKAFSGAFQCCWEIIICSFFPARHTRNFPAS